MKLSIIIPVFNEEKTVSKVLKHTKEIQINGVTKEVIVVDDGSTDKSINKIKDFVKNEKSSFKFAQHRKNLGKGSAVLTGIKMATGEYIAIQDADLEYDPKYFSILIKPILGNKADVVYGTRLNRFPHLHKEEDRPRFILQYLGNKFLSLITSLLYFHWITDMETGYKIFPKSIFKKISLHAKGFELEPEITAKILKQHLRFMEIPITTKPRGYEEGKKIQYMRDGPKAIWTLLKYRFVD